MIAEPRKPADIEAEIAAERSRLSRDLETLQDRLTVDGLMDEVKLQVRGQIDEVTSQLRRQFGAVSSDVAITLRDQIASASETVSRTAKQNPWPFAVIGLGAAWLAISALTPDRGARKPHVGMAPVKRTPVASTVSHYDSSPADMAAARLERDADRWAETVVSANANPIPPYDPEPTWARDDDQLTLTRP